MGLIKSVFRIARAKHRSNRYRVEHETLSVLRFNPNRPSKLSTGGWELFHKRHVFRTVAFCLSLGLLAVWTLNNYVELFRHMSS